MYNTGLKTTKTFLSCGCEIYEQNSKYHIKYCPLHKSAPQLLSACKAMLPLITTEWNGPIQEMARKAIAKAE